MIITVLINLTAICVGAFVGKLIGEWLVDRFL